jgi:putative tricarboxylic transport membrane protein
MRREDRITGIVVLLGAGAILIEAFQLEFSTDIGPGPGFFPVWLGAILAGLALLLIAQTYMKSATLAESNIPPRTVLIKVGTIFAALIAFVVVTPLIGFLAGASLFLLAAFSFIEDMKLRHGAPLAAAIACGFFLIFSVGLGVKLPTGIAGI